MSAASLPADEQRLAELKSTGVAESYENEIFKKDGTRVRVMVDGAIFNGTQDAAYWLRARVGEKHGN